jgi:hypothetical protein
MFIITVEELIEKLSKLPMDAKVVIAEYERSEDDDDILEYLKDIKNNEIHFIHTYHNNEISYKQNVQASILRDKFKLDYGYTSIVVAKDTIKFQNTIDKLNNEILQAKHNENLSELDRTIYTATRQRLIARMLEASEFLNSKEMEDLVKEKMPLNTVVLNLE